MGDLLAHVLPLALGAAISPTILVLNLFVLSDPHHGVRRSTAFVAGSGAVLVGVTVIAYAVIKPVSTAKGQPDAFFGWVDIVAAFALAGLGVRALIAPPKPPKQPDPRADSGTHLATWAAVGTGAMLTNFSTLVLYVPAVKDVAVSTVAVGEKVAVLVLLWIITMTCAWLPLVSVVCFGDRAVGALVRMRSWITVHQRTISAAVSFAFAVYLGIKGVRAVA